VSKKYSYFKIRLLREQGKTWAQIVEAVGCCENTVRRALLEDIDGFREGERKRKIKSRKPLLCHAVKTGNNDLNQNSASNPTRLISGSFFWPNPCEEKTKDKASSKR